MGPETHTSRPGRAARVFHQLSTTQGIHHERLVDPRLEDDALEKAATEAGLTDDERAMVEVLRREREREVRVPAAWCAPWPRPRARASHAWREAGRAQVRPLQPALHRLLSLRREQADAYGHGEGHYDAAGGL